MPAEDWMWVICHGLKKTESSEEEVPLQLDISCRKSQLLVDT